MFKSGLDYCEDCPRYVLTGNPYPCYGDIDVSDEEPCPERDIVYADEVGLEPDPDGIWRAT